MSVLLLRGLPGVIVMGLWIFCILDVIMSEETLIRNLPKGLWLILVIVIPVVGSIAWLIAGRPENAAFRIGDTRSRPAPPPRPALAPDDDPTFLREIGGRRPRSPDEERDRRLREWEEELRRREEELRRREGRDDGEEDAAS